jgi:poly-gamma-glutamate capsule biosynthesis protein CapA/YwtB (metallophosphatase superfamily)
LKSWRLLLLVAFCAFGSAVADAQSTLPVYFEDSHAGSFYRLAASLPLDEPCVLLHFDAHSDASGIFDSDAIRRRLRKVSSEEERHAAVDALRTKAVVECFNWIEPLMPRPFSRVIWIPAHPLAGKEAAARLAGAREALDAHTEVAPRVTGPVAPLYEVCELPQLDARKLGDLPIVASIDLDFFTGMSPRTRTLQFSRILDFVLAQPRLRTLTFAISRPYLRDDAEAQALLEMALTAVLEIGNAEIGFEPFFEARDPHSLLAERLTKSGKSISRYDITAAPPSLRHLLLAHADRLHLAHESERWTALLESWRESTPRWSIALEDHQPVTNGDWHLDPGEKASIALRPAREAEKPTRVLWWALEASVRSYNVVGHLPGGASFAADAPFAVRWRRKLVAETVGLNSLSSEKLQPFFDAKTGLGTVTLCADVIIGREVLRTAPVRIVRTEGSGFRAALTGQFNRPYIYGSSELRAGRLSGPEAGLGADCANFVIAGFRQSGRFLPWANPGQFRASLDLLASQARPGQPRIIAEQIARGLIVHLGTHVAAVMRDEPPIGILDAHDLVAHQLEGPPEIVPLGDFLADRKRTTFDLLQPRVEKPVATLVFGGDVMLGRRVGEGIALGKDPFAELAPLFREADVSWVNLECVVAEAGQGAPGKPLLLRAPVAAIESLRRAGLKGVGLGNNHAADFGAEGLREMSDRLRVAGIATSGTVLEKDGLHASILTTREGVRIALLPFLCEPGSPLIANVENRAGLAKAIADAHEKADCLIALPHWGDENRTAVTDDQRALACWLIDRGVDVIVGAGPHCLQSADTYRGRCIFYSLGNLVFDGPGPSPAWSKSELLKLELARDGRVLESLHIPVHIDPLGIPHLESSAKLFPSPSIPDSGHQSLKNSASPTTLRR